MRLVVHGQRPIQSDDATAISNSSLIFHLYVFSKKVANIVDMCGFLNTVIASYPTRNVCNIFSTDAFSPYFGRKLNVAQRFVIENCPHHHLPEHITRRDKSAARAGSSSRLLLNTEEKEVPAAAVAIRLVLDDDDVFALRKMLIRSAKTKKKTKKKRTKRSSSPDQNHHHRNNTYSRCSTCFQMYSKRCSLEEEEEEYMVLLFYF